MKKTTLLLLLLCAITQAQNVNIPDANFKNALLNHDPVIDTNNDGEISVTEAKNFTGKLYLLRCLYCKISDLTGIEAFVNITELDIFNHRLTSVDLSNNKSLVKLKCGSNNLTNLDISNNIALEELSCGSNKLTSLDVTNNNKLKILNCSANQLENLFFENNTELTELYCHQNQLTNLDLSSANNLKVLSCFHNLLQSLNLINNKGLTRLDCFGNEIKTIDVSHITNLVNFRCSMPTLECVTVSDENNIPQYWFKHNNTVWSNDCGKFYSYVNIPDENFRNQLITELKCDLNKDQKISFYEAEKQSILNLGNRNIYDLTGIEAFVNLTKLECQTNNLTSLDISNNIALEELSCGSNKLISLDVSNNSALTSLSCYNNQLTSLDVSNNSALTGLSCFNNQLTSLDVSNNSALTGLSCYNNQLTSLDVSNDSALTSLRCYNNQLTSLDVSQNSNLRTLDCRNNYIGCIKVADSNNIPPNYWYKDSSDIWSEDCTNFYEYVNIPDSNFKAALTEDYSLNTNRDSRISYGESKLVRSLNVNNKSISDLTGIEAFENINYLYCNNNQLTSLDLSNNKYLSQLSCGVNNITSINLLNNEVLHNLNCSSNQLTSLDLSNNSRLEYLTCNNNQLTSLDVSQNYSLRNINCIENDMICIKVKDENSYYPIITKDHKALKSQDCSEAFQYIDIPDSLFKQNLLDNYDINRNNDNQISVLEAKSYYGLIDVSQQAISKLNGIEKFINATEIYCQYNNIERLDISKNINLEVLKCYGNNLVALDLSQNPNLKEVFCYNNQDLDCIKVADETDAILDSWKKDDGAIWAEYCSNLSNDDLTDNTFKVYPNPATNFITIDSTLEGNYNLVSILGKTIAKGTLRQGENTIDLSNFDKGIYFLNVSSNNTSKTLKIVKD